MEGATGYEVVSGDYDWAGTWSLRDAPDLARTWNIFDTATGNTLGSTSLTLVNDNVWTTGTTPPQYYAIKARYAAGFTVASLTASPMAAGEHEPAALGQRVLGARFFSLQRPSQRNSNVELGGVAHERGSRSMGSQRRYAGRGLHQHREDRRRDLHRDPHPGRP